MKSNNLCCSYSSSNILTTGCPSFSCILQNAGTSYFLRHLWHLRIGLTSRRSFLYTELNSFFLSLVLVLHTDTIQNESTPLLYKQLFVHLKTVTLTTHLLFLEFLLGFEYHHYSGNFPLNSLALYIQL